MTRVLTHASCACCPQRIRTAVAPCHLVHEPWRRPQCGHRRRTLGHCAAFGGHSRHSLGHHWGPRTCHSTRCAGFAQILTTFFIDLYACGSLGSCLSSSTEYDGLGDVSPGVRPGVHAGVFLTESLVAGLLTGPFLIFDCPAGPHAIRAVIHLRGPFGRVPLIN